MIRMMRKCIVIVIVMIMSCFSIFLFPTAKTARAIPYNLTYPTFGLHCSQSNRIINGSVKFDLTDSELFAKSKAIKESEYRISGSQATTFEIPFYSTYIDIPQFNVTVNGQIVQGEVWYGDNQIYFGDDFAYLKVDSTDNDTLEKKLKRTYSPVLDDTVVGTLYIVTPDEDTFIVTMEVQENCCFVYDETNLGTYSPNCEYQYKNALSQTSYQFFFVEENSSVDFSATCDYEAEQMTFKEFIDRNYNFGADVYQGIGATKDCFYAIANRILQDKGGVELKELFGDWFNITALNAYKFTIPLNGEATIKYTSIANIKVIKKDGSTIYAIGQKQIGRYAVNYTMLLSNAAPYIVQSSSSTNKSGTAYTARATENFYFMCSSSKRQSSTQSRYSKEQWIVIIVCGCLFVVAVVSSIIGIVFMIRDKRKMR